MQLYQGDCLKIMKTIPDSSVNLVITDPPYNIGVKTKKAGKTITNQWDKIDHYIDWCVDWLAECQRVLTDNGVLYFWHNDIPQIADLLAVIKERTSLQFVSFCIWDKGGGYRARSWQNRKPDGKTALRSWFPVCEYCLHFFNAPKNADKLWRSTGLDRINSNPNCYQPLKQWYTAEKERLGITDRDIAREYTKATGKKPYMIRHYFQNSQFEIPTQKIWESVYEPLGFDKSYAVLRQEYESLRQEYESLRNVHICDPNHCNIWHVPPVSSANRLHTCQKPVEILERLIRVSSKPGDVVLDCFMGSGSTGVACLSMGREFIGIEKEPGYFKIAETRLTTLQTEPAQERLWNRKEGGQNGQISDRRGKEKDHCGLSRERKLQRSSAGKWRQCEHCPPVCEG